MNIRDGLTDKLIDSTIKFYDFFIIFGVVFIIMAILGIFFHNREVYEYSFGLAISLLALGLGCLSVRISRESDKRMRIIGEAEIQDSIVMLLQVRRRFFDDYVLYFVHYKEDEELSPIEGFRDERLKYVTEWATWGQIRCLKKALKFKEYLLDEDKRDILRCHRILINNIMQHYHIDEFLTNRHVKQLIMGCRLLKEELEELEAFGDNYENIYTELFKGFLLPRQENEDFTSYLNRNLEVLKDREEDTKFQIVSE